MLYKKGYAESFEDLISQIIAWTTDTTIHGTDSFELMRTEPWPRGTILKAHGLREGEKLYLGLMPNMIQEYTYRNWFMQKKTLATHFVWSSRGLHRNKTDFTVNANGVNIGETSYNFVDPPNIFETSARVLHFGVFKQYSDGLEWAEQAGGIDFDGVAMLPIQYQVDSLPNKMDFVPPVLPGVGYPSFSMDIGGPAIQKITYYLVKDRRSLIIVMNNGEYWDSAYLGLFEPYGRGEYAFPAVIVGGTSGFTSVGRDIYYTATQKTPTAVIGARVDYSMNNWSLTHGIATFSTVAYNNPDILCPAQVMLCLPDGRWQPFANYSQTLTALPEHVCSGSPHWHYFRREEPVCSSFPFFIRPTENEITDFGHVYDNDADKNIYKLEPLEFVQADGLRTGILGRLPYFYQPSRSAVRYGEITVNNKKHIMLPNVWEDRKYHINGYAGIVGDTNPNSLLAQERRTEKLSKIMNLLIRMEE